MGQETDIVEPVLSGRPAGYLADWVSGMFVWDICPGTYGESSELILM